MDIRSFFGGQKPAPPLADEEKNPTVNQKQKNVPKDELLDSDDDKIDDKLKSISRKRLKSTKDKHEELELKSPVTSTTPNKKPSPASKKAKTDALVDEDDDFIIVSSQPDDHPPSKYQSPQNVKKSPTPGGTEKVPLKVLNKDTKTYDKVKAVSGGAQAFFGSSQEACTTEESTESNVNNVASPVIDSNAKKQRVKSPTPVKSNSKPAVKPLDLEVKEKPVIKSSPAKVTALAPVKVESKPVLSAFKQLSSSSSSSSSSAMLGSSSKASDFPQFKKPAVAVPQSDTLWVDKYKPSSVNDIIGNKDILKKLLDWLKVWSKVHIEKSMKIPFSKENPGAKSVLISGPPGIGKTTLATLVATELGYETLELNASDTRSKKAITEQLADVVCSAAIGADGKTHKRLIIMDEVDGMGGSDRGGIPELIKVIKLSKTPIICICNDRQCQKIRSLANHCYDLRVRRPTKGQIAMRMVDIAKLEDMQVDPTAAEMLVEQMGNDIRQVLNCLQMWRAQSKVMKLEDMQSRLNSIEKDKILRQSPFDACQAILSGNKTDFNERYNSFFIDYALVPLLIQQNYVESAKNGVFRQQGVSDEVAMESLWRASNAVSDMDLAESGIRGADQHWELLPTEAAFAVAVGSNIRGFQGFPSFPAWLGKNSSKSKTKRLVQELVVHTWVAIGQGFTSIRLEYTPYLRSFLIKPLLEAGAGESAVEKTITLLDEYGLSRDDFMETMKELQFIFEKDPLLKDKFELLDSKTKSAFTRQYNQMEHRSQALVTNVVTKRTGGRGGRFTEDDEDEGLGEGTTEDLAAARADEEENDDDDVGDVSAFVKKQKAASKKSAPSSSSSSNKASTAKKGGKK